MISPHHIQSRLFLERERGLQSGQDNLYRLQPHIVFVLRLIAARVHAGILLVNFEAQVPIRE